MKALNRKLGRDLMEHAGVVFSVVAIIGVGAGLYVGMASAQRILETSQQAYYAEYRFADFWVELKKAPITAVEPLARLPEIEELQTRVVFDVIVDVPGEIQPVTGRLISVPRWGFDRIVNGVHLVRGPGFSDDRQQEVILAEPFALAHRLEVGDRVEIILNRKRESFVVAGTALSPEYVYMVRGEGDFVPDPRAFGVLYLKEDYAREVLGFQDACNSIVGRLAASSSTDVEFLLARIERALDPYGVLAATPRARQASHRFLSDEIQGLATTASILPAIFLLVAALVLNVAMSRLAERQRTVIGTLKAMGYASRAVLGHYLSLGAVVGVLGGVFGCGLGVLLSLGMIRMYRDFFQFPAYLVRAYPDLLATALAISLAFALSGTAKGVWKVLKLHPAEAMRPRPPQLGHRIALERWRGLWRRLGFRTHMALRTLFRNPTRSLTGVAASALGTALILSTLSLYDSVQYMVDFQFRQVRHSDIDLGMRDEASVRALLEARDFREVDDSEPVLTVACTLQHGPAKRRLAVMGLRHDHRLTTPVDAAGTPIEIPPAGLVLSRKLAEVLGVGVGQSVELTPVRGDRTTRMVPVASVVEGFFGLECYADIDYLSDLVDESLAVNAIQMNVDPAQAKSLFRRIKELPNVQGLSIPSQERQNIEATFAKSLGTSLGLTIVFAAIIGLGTTLSASLVEMLDRRREIATLRVMGYRPGQVAGIFIRESTLVFGTGMAMAVPLSWALVKLIAKAYDTELYRMPVVFQPRTILTALAISSLFLLIAHMVVYQQVRRADWAEAVKLKE